MTTQVPFSAEAFVENLLQNGSQVYCDDSNQSFCKGNELPEFYNERKFKRGQKFYHHQLVGMLLAKLMGLITILSIPTISSLLEFTQMSSEPLTAYKRYMATIFHVVIWYDEDFNPSSNTWKSLKQVKAKHNNASKRGCMKGLRRISQMDMALTQFGFIGFQVTRSTHVGIHYAKKEEFEDFIHVWKVVGHIMGIEERFNICRDSFEETEAICNCLIQKVFNPAVQKNSSIFSQLSKALFEGMWCMLPYLQYNVFSTILLQLLHSPDDPPSDEEFTFENQYAKLTRWQRVQYFLVTNGIKGLENPIFNFIQVQMMYLALWLMKNFPFLAFYKFGKENSFVHVLDKPVRNHKSG